jgi:hypothetical protein
MTSCPVGYRFLVQLMDEDNEQLAREHLCRMFGARKGNAAVLESGKLMIQRPGGGWCLSPVLRAYLPLGWR